MAGGCVFCEIAGGREPAAIVYEDDFCIAFMDIYPVSRGHVLVAPRTHYERITDMDLDSALKLFSAVYRVVHMVSRALKPDGIRIVQNNGGAAGQVVMHVHFHVIPFYRGAPGYRRRASLEELREVAGIIRSAGGP